MIDLVLEHDYPEHQYHHYHSQNNLLLFNCLHPIPLHDTQSHTITLASACRNIKRHRLIAQELSPTPI